MDITNTKSDNIYFAAKEPKKTASILAGKASEWTNFLETNGYLEKLRALYAAYHGAYYSTVGNSHQISFTGEQGELTQIPINHLRNLAQHMLVITTSNRPTMEARASNTDYKSLVQTKLANGILEYYMRDKHVERYLKNAAEMAIVFGAGFIKMAWNATAGEIYDVIEETDTPVYEGDIEFVNLSPFDVVYDGSKESSQDPDWVLTRTWKNKFDLAAKYPELETKIKDLPTKSDEQKFRLGIGNLVNSTDDVQVLEFYHRKTDCLPNGRYMMFLSDDLVLQDVGLPYRFLPVLRIAPSDILGTPYGYTPLMDLLPLQEGINTLYSTILTNQNAFGVQNIYVPRGADISVNNLAGGLNVIEGNAQAGEPKPLNLTQTPGEVFKFVQMLEQVMETLSGVNSVARGNPEASLKSGTALALVQSMTLQFLSGLQQSYVQLIEDVGGGIIKILQDYAKAPRLIAIAGKSNRTEMQEFNSDHIVNISRVVVDVGNPLAQTTAGRVQMAEQLIQYGEITPKQYVTLVKTGNLDQFTEENDHENLLMRAENEKIIEGELPPVTVVDDHMAHIKFHRGVLADPDLRKDAELVARATQHINMHINQLRTADPGLLQLMGQQPLPPLPGSQPNLQQQGGPAPGPEGQAAQGVMQPPPQGQEGLQQQNGHIQGPGLSQAGARLPGLPSVKGQLLPNPQAQANSMGNVK